MSDFRRKKYCRFSAGELTIDYKDVKALKNFINEAGMIVPSRVTGTRAEYQRPLATAIKRARYLGLLKYCDAHKV